MTTEEKARQYAEEKKKEYYTAARNLHLDGLGWECEDAYLAGYKEASKDAKKTIKDTKHGCRFAYRKGAAEALRSQWRDASKELPKKGEEVLICFKDNPSEVYACDFDGDVFIGRHGVANNVYLWMSRPPLLNTQEQ